MYERLRAAASIDSTVEKEATEKEAIFEASADPFYSLWPGCSFCQLPPKAQRFSLDREFKLRRHGVRRGGKQEQSGAFSIVPG